MQARRLLALALCGALAGLLSFPAQAELLKNLKTDGSIEVRAFGIDNETDGNGVTEDYRNEMRTRTMVGGSFDLLDDVHGRILLRKNGRVYGSAANANGGQIAGSQSINAGAASILGGVFVDNANIKIDKVFGHVDLTVGRQFYGHPDDLVIYFGPNPDDLLTVNALDSLRVDTSVSDVHIMGIVAKAIDGEAGAAPAGANSDTDGWGLEANTDKVIPKGNLAAYYYGRQIKRGSAAVETLGQAFAVPADHDTVHVYGLRARGDIPALSMLNLNYVGEFAFNMGRDGRAAGRPTYSGRALLLGVKGNTDVGPVGDVRAGARFGYGSGNKPGSAGEAFVGINPGLRFGKIWGEHTNSAAAPSVLNPSNTGAAGAVGITGLNGSGLANLQVWHFNAGVTPKVEKRFSLDADLYMFTLNEQAAGAATSTDGAREFDLAGTWKHSDNVSIEVSYAVLAPTGGGFLTAAPRTASNNVTRYGVNFNVKF